MAKAEKKDNKELSQDKSPKKAVKSSYSKKKKTKKNILNGIAYVQSTFNNTIISIADTNGNVISWASAGQKGFKGSRKSTPYAAQIAADAAASKALEFGMKTLSVEVKGPGSGHSYENFLLTVSCSILLGQLYNVLIDYIVKCGLM